MTTIVTKNGSGAPLASDLVQGELAVDLTNKRLYTEDAGGTVIEVGTNPSTIDINAGTIDGTVIGGASAAAGTFTTFTSTGIDDNATSTAITIDSSQNVGVGTSSPDAKLHVKNDGAGSISAGLFLENGGGGAGNGIAINYQTSGTAQNTMAQIATEDDGNYGYDLYFATKQTGSSGGALTERMRIDSSGNVGIGTTSPAATFGKAGSLDANGIVVSRGQLNANQTNAVVLEYGSNVAAIRAYGATAGTGQLVFKTGGGGGSADNEAMRIDASGNVGIGTTSPSSELEIEGSEPTLTIQRTDNTNDSSIVFLGSGGGVGTALRHKANDNILAFDISTSEAMRLTSSGRLLIGKTTDTGVESVTSGSGFAFVPAATGEDFAAIVGTGGNNALLYLNQRNLDSSNPFVIFYSNNGSTSNSFVGSITHNGSSTSYNTSSDYRLKENVVDLDNGIDRLKQIPVHRFNFIADPDTTVDGFIAHEVQDVVPEAILGTKDAVDDEGNPEYQGIDQSKLVPLLTAALQEAVTRIETLEAEVAALKGA